MKNNKNNATDTITPLLKKLIPYMLFANVPIWLFSLIWGFDLTMIIGLFVGTIYCILAYFYLGRTINLAVRLSKRKAQGLMLSCYFIRFLGLGILGYFALKYDFMNFVGLLLPQFYPRIILSFMGFNRKSRF